ncbi:protein of unknown function [Tepidibacter aestuarii]|nr:protein of unknown function [Tepidibacter aestuarii]
MRLPIKLYLYTQLFRIMVYMINIVLDRICVKIYTKYRIFYIL